MKKSLRHAYAEKIVELGRKNNAILALECDLKESTQSIQFQEAFPERYLEVGIQEQNMIGIAAGMALEGKIPVCHTFACFASMRACEQVRTTVAYPRLNVKIVVSHAGISAGTAGTTHHAIEDLAIMRAIPNMTVLAPGDAREVGYAIEEAIACNGPVYMRLSAVDADDIYTEKDRFAIGKATLLREGGDATIITTGTLMAEGVAAADLLRKQHGISARVLQMASIKPIDEESIRRAAEETGRIVTVEEHTVLGGLGGAVCEVAAQTGKAAVKRLGIQDHFCSVGTVDYLREKEGLTVGNIVAAVTSLIR